MAGTLREDLASLKIERRGSTRPEPSRPRGNGSGMGFLSALLWLIPAGLLAGAGSVAYFQYEKIKPRTEVTLAVVQEMTTGEAETLLSAKGYVKSEYQAMIGAKIPGRVARLFIKEGDEVPAGFVLAELEHRDLDAQLAQREAMLKRTEAERREGEAKLKGAQADLQMAQADFALKDLKANRRTQLGSRGSVTGEELEQYLYDRKMAQNKIDSLKAAIAAQEAALAAQDAASAAQQAMIDEMRAQIEDMKVKAPHAGTVTEKGAEVGETILIGGMGGASGRGSVATLADLKNLEVDTDIAENLLAHVEPPSAPGRDDGQPAEISVSAVPSRRYQGRLTRIIPMGDRTRGTVKVRVKILDPDRLLFPELVATVHFLPKKGGTPSSAGQTFLFVPKAALVEEAGHQHVWRLGNKGKVQRQMVEVVVTKDDLARVEKGLRAGDKVVLNPPATLHDGQVVSVAE